MKAKLLSNIFNSNRNSVNYRKYEGIGAFIITFSVLATIIAPILTKRVSVEEISKQHEDVVAIGDEPDILTGKPYLYEEFIKPENSFGLGSTIFSEVNWTYWQKWVNNSIDCYLEKSIDAKKTWKECTKLLHVAKDWDELNISVKFTFSWVSNEDAYYRVSYKTTEKATLSSSSDKTAKGNSYLLNYSVGTRGDEIYSCSYNWTDYKNSNEFSKTTFTKEVIPHTTSNKPEFVWCVTTKDIMKNGESMEIDPTLGNTASTSYTGRTANFIRGGKYTMGAVGGTADDITVRFYFASAVTVKCAIYNAESPNDNALVGETEERSFSGGGSTWATFNITSGGALVANKDYYIVYWVSANTNVYYTSGTNYYYVGDTYDGNFPDPWAPDTGSSYIWVCYTNYTVGGGFENTPPVSNDLYPGNGSTGISVSLGNWSVQITDADGNNTEGNFSVVPTGVMNYGTQWNSSGNGTREVNLSTLAYDTEYKVYVNFSDTAMDLGDEVKNWFTFTTGSATSITINNLTSSLLTWNGTQGSTAYTNNSGTGRETGDIEIYIATGDVRNATNISIGDLNTNYLHASNLSIQFSSDNSTWGDTWSTFTDGGSNVTIRNSTWDSTHACYGSTPFTENNAFPQTDTTHIYFRVKLNIPSNAPVNTYSIDASNWTVYLGHLSTGAGTEGYTSELPSVFNLADADDLLFDNITLTEDVLASSISAWLNPDYGEGNHRIKYVLYDSSLNFVTGGHTKESEQLTGSGMEIVDLMFNNTLDLSAGEYYLAVHCNSTISGHGVTMSWALSGYDDAYKDSDCGEDYGDKPDILTKDSTFSGDALAIWLNFNSSTSAVTPDETATFGGSADVELLSESLDPNVVINFAGNLDESGGPAFSDTGCSINADEGYYTNMSMQEEGWMYINCTITDNGHAGIDDAAVWLNWKNDSTWTNWTYLLANKTGGYYEINTSGNISTAEGFNYGFDIVANDTQGNFNRTCWNKTAYGEANEDGSDGYNLGITRRSVQLNCTTEAIGYKARYLYYFPYDMYSGEVHDHMFHDQGTDGGNNDTGFWRYETPPDTFERIYCGIYAGAWFDDSICLEDTEITNFYSHWWIGCNDTARIGVEKTRGVTPNIANTPPYINFTPVKDNRSKIVYDAGLGCNECNKSYYLMTGQFSDLSYNVTDNNIYEMVFGIHAESGDVPQIISNRSFNSFIIINLPDNATLDASHNDTDGDGLYDRNELFDYYTNPFLADTDNDGESDYNETIMGTDPNNFTDHTPYNNAPTIVDTNPANNSVDVDINFDYFYFNASDADGDYMNCTCYLIIEGCNQKYENPAAFTDGMIQMLVSTESCLPLEYDTTYTWTINLTDDASYTNETFVFTTKSESRSWQQPIEHFSFGFSNTTSMQQPINHWSFDFSNTTTMTQPVEHFSFDFSNTTQSKETFSFGFDFSNTSDQAWMQSINNFVFAFANTTPMQQPINHFIFSFGNTTDQTWQQPINHFSFSFSNTTTTQQSIDDFTFSFSNTSVYNNVFYSSFSFSNTSDQSWQQPIEHFSFDFSNTTSSQNTVYWSFDFSNTSLAQEVFSFNFSFANTSDQGWQEPFSVWSFGFSNTTTMQQPIDHFSFDFSNTSDQSWQQPINHFSFDFSNTTIMDKPIEHFSFDFSNTTNHNEVFQWWLTFSNTTNEQDIDMFNFSFSNSSVGPLFGTPSPANNSVIYSTTYQWSIQINDTIPTFSWSINCSNEQNASDLSDINGTKTINLTGLLYQTYTVWVNVTDGTYTPNRWFTFTVSPGNVSGSFTYNRSGQVVTVEPTLGNAVTYYKWQIENDVNGETEWIPAADLDTKHYLLNYDERYNIILHYKNDTIVKEYRETIVMPKINITADVPTAPPEETTDKYKNVFDNVPDGIKKWFADRSEFELGLIALPILFLFIFFAKKKRKKVLYSVKTEEVNKNERRRKEK